jgi:hypothetical protein
MQQNIMSTLQRGVRAPVAVANAVALWLTAGRSVAGEQEQLDDLHEKARARSTPRHALTLTSPAE